MFNNICNCTQKITQKHIVSIPITHSFHKYHKNKKANLIPYHITPYSTILKITNKKYYQISMRNKRSYNIVFIL